jgi:hypothetical protein
MYIRTVVAVAQVAESMTTCRDDVDVDVCVCAPHYNKTKGIDDTYLIGGGG